MLTEKQIQEICIAEVSKLNLNVLLCTLSRFPPASR